MDPFPPLPTRLFSTPHRAEIAWLTDPNTTINGVIVDSGYGGTLRVAPDTTLSVTGCLTQAGGRIGGQGTVSINGGATYAWSAGTMTDLGRTIIGGTLAIMQGGTAIKAITDRDLVNYGATQWFGGDFQLGNLAI